MDTAQLKKYVEVRHHAQHLKSEAESARKRADEMETSLLEQMEQEGVSSVKLDGLGTVSMHRIVWCSAIDADPDDPDTGKDVKRTVAALREFGGDDLVDMIYGMKLSTQSLSGFVRDLEKEGEIPDIIRENVKISPKVSLRVTVSG